MKRAKTLIPQHIQALKAYVPGEQPRIAGLIKLNTNENPYPPSPKVLRAVKEAVDGRLRLYPDPNASALRAKLGQLHQCSPANIILGNGSDELLALAVRTFVDAKPGRTYGWSCPGVSVVQYLPPSYSLYPVLADIHGVWKNPVPLEADFSLPDARERKRARLWTYDAALTFVTTPNAPSGRAYTKAELESICRDQEGVVVLDEAYVDFAEENALALALKYPNVLVARTFSKAYSLCFQRVGYFVGHPDLIQALDKTRDSYNVNGLGQVAALATLEDLPYYRKSFQKVKSTREKLATALTELGFHVFPSQTNFILVRPPKFEAAKWLEKLRQNKLLVRWFDQEGIRDCLRITVGTDAEAAALVKVAAKLV
jgi:histidinol-phosphate aminotransferase